MAMMTFQGEYFDRIFHVTMIQLDELDYLAFHDLTSTQIIFKYII